MSTTPKKRLKELERKHNPPETPEIRVIWDRETEPAEPGTIVIYWPGDEPGADDKDLKDD